MITTFVNATLVHTTGMSEGMSVIVADGIITDIFADGSKKAQGNIIDVGGEFLSAGFIDIHVHGGGGCDFMDATVEAFKTIFECHMRHGTTTLSPTALTASMAELVRLGEAASLFRLSETAGTLPHMLGLHLEGPFIAEEMKGAQDANYMIHTVKKENYDEILKALDHQILIWTTAPELPGALDMCRDLRSRGIYFSAGHSAARYEDVKHAAEAGYSMVTHLYSGMSTITRVNGYRKLGLIESSYLFDELYAEIIADGEHLPPELLRLIVKTKGVDKLILVTDAMRGVNMPEGKYILGSSSNGQMTIVDGKIARMPDGISFGGSIATADRLVRVMVKDAGVPLHEAVRMITVNPARAVGIFKHKGSVEVGKDADLVVFNEDISVKHVMVGGVMRI